MSSSDEAMFTVGVRVDPSATTVVVTGGIDIAGAPVVSATVDSAATYGRVVIIDLAAVTFIDSSGLHALLDLPTHPRTQRVRRGAQ